MSQRRTDQRAGGRAAGGDPVDDPFAVLGLDASATLDDLRAARRRLARQLHPDVQPGASGAVAAMQQVNEAFDRCVGHVTGRRPIPQFTRSAETAPAAPPRPQPQPARRRRPAPRRFRGVEYDTPSFTIDALPAEAFEALLLVCAWIGEVIDDDPPYVLECVLTEPAPCWCRLELVPDAGGSTVSLAVAPVDDGGATERVSAEEVRDEWVAQLNRLGRQMP